MDDETKKKDLGEMDLRSGIENEMIGLVEYLNSIEDPSSDNYKEALKSTLDLGNLWVNINRLRLEEQKITFEHNDKVDQRALDEKRLALDDRRVTFEHDDKSAQRALDEKLKELELQYKSEETVSLNQISNREKWIKIIAEAGKIAIPAACYIAMGILGWANENHPIRPHVITSGTTKQTNGNLTRLF